MNEAKQNEAFSLEENLKALDSLINNLERGELTLEQSFAEYKKGMDLLLKCNNSVEKIERELEILESEGI